MNDLSVKSIKRSKLMYIFEATLEYFISILVADAYLATLTKELGFSDNLTGILSSIISLGCLFQLLSLLIRRKKFKFFVLVFSILNQLLFILLYVVPLTNFENTTKIIIFVILTVTDTKIYYPNTDFILFDSIRIKNWFKQLFKNGQNSNNS
jgi:hypothetical protein